MSGYTTIVVGTDGSDSSLRAVDKAGQIAAGSDAKVIVATAYFPQSEDQRCRRRAQGRGLQDGGQCADLRDPARGPRPGARRRVRPTSRSRRSSARRLTRSSISPRKSSADLLVVGNVGLSTIAGRLLGSVPANVARRSKTDVLIVHTTP